MSFDQLKRREFITLLGGAAAWPVAARAQQPTMPIVGYLSAQAPTAAGPARYLAAFQQGLRDSGYVEGRNLIIEYRWAAGQYDRLPGLAAELIGRPVAVIAATGGDVAARAAKAATTTIPIIFTTGGDPVQNGLVASLSRPGGNLTGVTSLNVEVGPKRLELLHELLPAATEVALLINPNNPNAGTRLRETEAAARPLGVQIQVLRASTERDIDMIIASWAQQRAGPLVISSDAYLNSRSEQIGALVLNQGMPTIFQDSDFAAAGGLMSYGGSNTEMYRLVGGYAGRILKGEKPADLPVQQTTKVELIINLKTAKALGLTVPLSLLTRADEVIE
jgi:putative tryptophan/tyrosine transport system substrate-binding protein